MKTPEIRDGRVFEKLVRGLPGTSPRREILSNFVVSHWFFGAIFKFLCSESSETLWSSVFNLKTHKNPGFSLNFQRIPWSLLERICIPPLFICFWHLFVCFFSIFGALSRLYCLSRRSTDSQTLYFSGNSPKFPRKTIRKYRKPGFLAYLSCFTW